jgi:nucleoside-diphosphate-sugar epimerase
MQHCKGMDVVFHCAAKISFWRRDKEALYNSNVCGTRNMVNAALQQAVPAFIQLSSVAALGRPALGSRVISENSPWQDSPMNSDYAKSKYLAELEVWRAAEEGLSVAFVNPGVILGLGDGRSGSNQIFELVRRGLRFYPAGSNGFVMVEDVCRLMISIWEQELYGQHFIAVSHNLTYKEVLDTVAKNLHKNTPNIKLDGLLLKTLLFFGRFFEGLGLRPPFPYQGLLSTSAHWEYHSENSQKINNFEYKSVLAQLPATLDKMY